MSPSTHQDWDNPIGWHLKPTLGDVLVAKLTAQHCDQLYAGLTAP